MSLVATPSLEAVLARSMPASLDASAREREAWFLARCAAVVAGHLVLAEDLREASVFASVATAVRSQRPDASVRLAAAAAGYLSCSGESRVPLDEMVRRGWLPGMPRVRDSLLRMI